MSTKVRFVFETTVDSDSTNPVNIMDEAADQLELLLQDNSRQVSDIFKEAKIVGKRGRPLGWRKPAVPTIEDLEKFENDMFGLEDPASVEEI